MSDLTNDRHASKSMAARIAQARAVVGSQDSEDSLIGQQHRGFANIDQGPPVEGADRDFISRSPGDDVRGFLSVPVPLD